MNLCPKTWLQATTALARTHLYLEPEDLDLNLPQAQKAIGQKETPCAFLKHAAEKYDLEVITPFPEESHIPTQGEMLEALKSAILRRGLHPSPHEQEIWGKNLVFGEGNPTAEIVLVGEAPGEEEDRLGLPFVGRSGKLLEKLLTSIGMQRSEIYIANVIKHRPPGNRDPLPEEKKRMLPTLVEQLDIINPKIIATLGRHSTMSLLGENSKVQKIRGKLQRDAQGRVVVPIFHPAAALYDASKLGDLEAQFLLLQAVASGRIKPPTFQAALL